MQSEKETNIVKAEKRPKALVLFSGGLDSLLAIKLIMNQGIKTETVNFITPFSSFGEQFADKFCEENGIKVHKIFLGEEFLDIVVKPKHGYGSQMNPCVDCRILMLKKAKDLAEKIGADFIVTGEVLDERPLSQRKEALLTIEKEADLEGKILRPLSAKLLPESELEKKGIVRREKLLDIRGRRRLRQMEIAKILGVKDYPNPSGGCLLTEPRFVERLREHLKWEKRLTLKDAELFRMGRHFRVHGAKVIVGRNEEENLKLQSIAKRYCLATMETVDHVGPVTLLLGKENSEIIKKTASITARYSDAPKGNMVRVKYKTEFGEQILEAKSIEDEENKTFKI